MTRVESRLDSCDADTIQESELQETVIKAINSILAQKSTAIGVLQENIEEVLKQENSPTKDVDGKLEELQKQLLQRANKNEKYDDLVEEVYKLREEKQRILADKAELEGVKQSIFNMKAFLNSQTAKIEEYDEQLVRRLIAKVTVYDERFEVELKSGISVDIQRNK
ncbi:MAG: DNA recombinase [Oscillospiraceae bacterium]|nr:DNA recombinase [Oscillospiraceae bacterium]MDE7288991.1 DNA recombinase [Oscillospiraceae bacterium]